MAEFKIPTPGEICWRELATKDLAKSMDFYSNLFGWSLPQTKMSPMDYKEIVIDNIAYGGMMEINETWGENPPPSHWKTYVAVENADETVEKIKANGGAIDVPPFHAPGVGRMSIVSDPSGAIFAIIQFAAAS